MKQELESSLQRAVELLLDEQASEQLGEQAGEQTDGQRGENAPRVSLTRPKIREHGDYATNIAMPLAGKLGMKPRDVATRLLEQVIWPTAVERTEIAGPGFINIHLQQASEASILARILAEGGDYGRVSDAKAKGQSVCVEFISANPTGPMHVGHGRGAVVGDALASVLAARGMAVSREYYINDAGVQIGKLADSIWFRICEISLADFNENMPEGCYPGDYIVEAAACLLKTHAYNDLAALAADERRALLCELGIDLMMAMVRDDLVSLGIRFDTYFSEKSLHESGAVQALIAQLKEEGRVYLGCLPAPKGKEIKDYTPTEQWLFRTTDYGDDVDRPLAKQDGTATYFAADIAYHVDKIGRGFDRLIDVWGADHGGYVKRVQASVEALTGKKQQPEVVLVQMVNLTRDGKPVRMSKRAGTFVTLREVVDEVGSDAVRFNFLTRRVESQLDFDLETAKQKNDENPVYYVQYAHARVCAILRKATSEGVAPLPPADVDVSPLVSDEERRLVRELLAWPEVLEQAAKRLEPYRVAIYLMQLAAALHSFYHKHRVVVDDADLAQARLLLVLAVRQVLANGLKLLGVGAPEQM
ncbi:MAG: arginine--tRNA ligase [Mariprofundaceae bacterium]|nr:arginine--tRNA ligase [Mariprofundaceae bacterium]